MNLQTELLFYWNMLAKITCQHACSENEHCTVKFRRVEIRTNIECVVKLWSDRGRITIANLYNPYIKIELLWLDEIMGTVSILIVIGVDLTPIICCGVV